MISGDIWKISIHDDKNEENDIDDVSQELWNIVVEQSWDTYFQLHLKDKDFETFSQTWEPFLNLL